MRSLPTPVLTARHPLPERMGPPSNPRTFSRSRRRQQADRL